MAADTTILQGEVFEDPKVEPLNVEALLTALLRSLIQEQASEGEARS
jgi:hypothetical protein